MRISLSLKWWVVVVVCLAIVGCSEESSQNEPTPSGDSGTQDGSDTESDSATLSCGDGRVEGSEECDDGEANSDELADACRTNCQEAACGDGVIDIRLNETCDDGNSINDDACNNLCRSSSCGDGVLQPDEACDDGPDNSDTRPNACRTNCTEARCGDSATDSGEDCDDGNTSNLDDCIDCVAARCGDGLINLTVENCDDENSLSLDGCNALCQEEPGFECQNGPSVCTTICGDQIVAGTEKCDDGNNLNGDYCASNCSDITGQCGDGIQQSNEQCDDGNLAPGDYCSPLCNTSGFCGDGVIQTPMGELCDDGNTTSGDGCLSNCSAFEPGWDCFLGSPTSCSLIFCEADHRVQNNACERCPPGTSNIAGDNATGPDTLCETVFCATDQYVQNNACVACAVGMVNDAGDNASGTNTVCDPDPCYPAFGVLCRDFEQAYIKASNTDSGDNFGYPVALDGDTLAVGASLEDSNATGINGDQADESSVNSGAVYVFTRSGTIWTQQAYIKASNTGANDNFGYSIALSGNTLAVSAWEEDSNAIGMNGNQANESSTDSGAVYVFTRSGTTWAQQAYIKASNSDFDDNFGQSVALSGDTLAVSAYGEDSNATGVNGSQSDNSLAGSGAVYLFTRSGTTWTQRGLHQSL